MKEYFLCVVVERQVVEVMLEVPKLTKAAVPVWELVVLEVVEVEEVEVVEVEVSVGESGGELVQEGSLCPGHAQVGREGYRRIISEKVSMWGSSGGVGSGVG